MDCKDEKISRRYSYCTVSHAHRSREKKICRLIQITKTLLYLSRDCVIYKEAHLPKCLENVNLMRFCVLVKLLGLSKLNLAQFDSITRRGNLKK